LRTFTFSPFEQSISCRAFNCGNSLLSGLHLWRSHDFKYESTRSHVEYIPGIHPRFGGSEQFLIFSSSGNVTFFLARFGRLTLSMIGVGVKLFGLIGCGGVEGVFDDDCDCCVDTYVCKYELLTARPVSLKNKTSFKLGACKINGLLLFEVVTAVEAVVEVITLLLVVLFVVVVVVLVIFVAKLGKLLNSIIFV
jgi:hypothetical protein